MKKFFIIAGEASGDLLGSKLIRELKTINPESEFVGVGGNLMQEQGLISIFPIEELSVMGFLEVVPHIPKLLRRIRQTADVIIKEKPDFIVTIDAPDFCFRVMKKIQKLNHIKKIHLIAPSVWAYRAGRAKKISKFYDLLLCVLPFEPPYFEKHGLRTVFIGHPILENAPDFSQKNRINSAFRKKYSIDESDMLIVVMPGSRTSEVKKIFPEFIGAINFLAKEKPNLRIAIPLVEKTKQLVLELATNLEVKHFFIEKDEKESAFISANFALAKSGTNTLELSLYRVPMIIAYKVNFITYLLAKMMLKIRFANLINLALNEEVIPEMIQKNCDAKRIFFELKKLISDQNLIAKQLEKSAAALKIFGLGNAKTPTKKAVEEILK